MDDGGQVVAQSTSTDVKPVAAPFVPRRARGYLLAFCGCALVTPDAALVRLATAYAGGTFWWIISFKCLFLSVMILLFVAWQHGWRNLPPGLRAGPAHCALVAFMQMLVTIGFPATFQTTTAAKGLLLINMNPLWASLLGWRILGDTLPRRTIIAMAGAFLALCLVFIPPLLLLDSSSPDDATEGFDPSNARPRQRPQRGATADEAVVAADGVGNWRGDLIGILTGFALASLLTSARFGAQRRPKALMALAMALGAGMAGLVTLAFACAVAWDDLFALRLLFWPLMLADAACIAACTVLALTFAPRHISPGEVALVLLLELVGGPLWVAVGGFETPSVWTMGGGGLLVLVLAVHEIAAMREARAAAARNRKAETWRVASPRGGSRPATPTGTAVAAQSEIILLDVLK